MPTGIIVNVAVVAIGGILGVLFKKKFPKCWINTLPLVFSLCAMTMGVTYMVKLQNLSAVVLALILGTMIGELIAIESKVAGIVGKATSAVPVLKMTDEQMETFTAVTVLFCASGAGIFGSMNAGFTGDHSILFAKSILDFFTAIIFGITLGGAVSLIAIPQSVIQFSLFFCAALLMPFITDAMSADFKACGGIITLAVGLKMLNVQRFKVVNMVPALIIVMPLSALWTTYIG